MISNSISRERGTLLETLPQGWWILVVNHLACTAFGTFLSQYSFHNIEYLDIGIGIKVALGVASSMAAILHTDAFLFLVTFTISVCRCGRITGYILAFFSTHENISNPFLHKHVATNFSRRDDAISRSTETLPHSHWVISVIAAFFRQKNSQFWKF